MSANDLQLLTSALESAYRAGWQHSWAQEGGFDGSQRAKEYAEFHAQALADGRTACVEVRSEAQAREAFEKWYVAWPRGSWPTADGSWPTPDGIWFAALRYAGALKPPIVVCDECGAVSNDNHREDCMYTGEVR